MRTSTHLIVGLVFAVAAAVITPPDRISQISVMLEMVAVYGLLLFIVSRFKSFARTPERMKTVIVVLVCLVAIAVACATTFFAGYQQVKTRYHKLLQEQWERDDSAASVEAIE